MTLPAALPPVIPEPFAQNADPANINNPIPETTGTAGLASYDVGFPPITFEPVVAGGIPPEGQDFNGIFFAITAHLYYLQSGQRWPFNATVAAAIGGYPVGAIVEMADGTGEWICIAPANSANPDTAGTGWVPLSSIGTASVPLSSPTTTLSIAQAKKPVIVLTGVLTANVAVNFPARAAEWLVINQTSGAFAVTLNAGTGISQSAPQGGFASPLGVYSIGDQNLYPSVSPLGVPISQGADPSTLAERTNGGNLVANAFAAVGSPANVSIVNVWGDDGTGLMNRVPLAFFESLLLLSAIGGQVTAGQVPASAVTQYTALILASATLTGTPTAPTQTPGTANTTVATTAFVNPGSSLNTNGYRNNPDGSLDQWGQFNTTANVGTISIPFNIPFPTACYGVEITVVAPSGLGGAGSYQAFATGVPSPTAQGYRTVSSANPAITLMWRAIGK